MLLCNTKTNQSTRHIFIAEGETHFGYFRRCGFDLSRSGVVLNALLVTAGVRAGRGGFGASCASGWMSEGVGVGVGVGVGFSDADADGAGLGVGCDALPSRPRDSAFARRLLLVLVGREGCADALFGCGRSDD